MDSQTLAITLIALRIIAIILLVATIVKQVDRLRTTTTEYPGVRIAVFAATVILLVGQIIPMMVLLDMIEAAQCVGCNNSLDALSTGYAVNNVTKDVIMGALLAVQHYRPRYKR